MQDGSPVPEYYSIEAETGVISCQNQFSLGFFEDAVRVVVTGSSLVSNTPSVLDFTIINECGKESTDVIAPSFDPIERPSNRNSPNFEVTGSFTSSNELCPMESQALLSGDELQFEFTVLPSFGIFSVSLRDTPIPYSSIVNTYEYSVIGTAVGGAAAVASG